MELTNKRVSFSVDNSTDNVKFVGATVSLIEDVVKSISGSVSSTDGLKNGYFSCEDSSNNVSWNYNGDPTIEDYTRALVRDTISVINSSVNS